MDIYITNNNMNIMDTEGPLAIGLNPRVKIYLQGQHLASLDYAVSNHLDVYPVPGSTKLNKVQIRIKNISGSAKSSEQVHYEKFLFEQKIIEL